MIVNGWWPRDYQIPFCEMMENGGLRADCCWHRRAGKDLTALNITVSKAIEERPGLYYHLFPTSKQGRKVLWTGKDRGGRDFMSYWPKELITRRLEDEMMLEVRGVHGGTSIWQISGTDRESIDRLVGSNPVGVIFSEWSLHEPKAWDLLRPILAENGGWAAFLYTPRGRNHAYSQHLMAKTNPQWFGEVLTVDQTKAVSLEAIEAERRAGMSEEMIQQEFYCSFNAPQYGAYYGKEMMAARAEERIRPFKPQAHLATHTAWDLGFDDAMAIWWFQIAGREIHLTRYYENSGEGLSHYVRVLQAVKEQDDLVYGQHWAPHDIDTGEFSTGKTRKQTAQELGIKFRVVPRTPNVLDDIENCRQILPRCYFRSPECDDGVGHLESYRKEWNDKLERFQDHPRHDRHSHGADSFRTLCGALRLGAGQSFAVKPDADFIALDEMYRSV